MPTDPASLQNLHDIVMPSPVPWWPPAPGWYVIACGALVLCLWIGWKTFRYRAANRYRKMAVLELDRLGALAGAPETREQALQQLPKLLKRTALAAYRRPDVAALTGNDWLRFLDRSGQTDAFTRGAGRRLTALTYKPREGSLLSAAEVDELLQASRRWIMSHARETAPTPDPKEQAADH